MLQRGLSSALIPLMASVFTAGVATAASIGVGVDLGPRAPSGLVPVVRTNEGRTVSLDFYLDLQGDEVASVFDADFDITLMGDWSWSLDLSRVQPGVAPFGVGTWDAESSETASSVGVTLLSDNMGGARLVAQLLVTLEAAGIGDRFAVSLASGAVVSRDLDSDPFSEGVPFSTQGGQPLATLVPEPGTALLLLVGLATLAVARR